MAFIVFIQSKYKFNSWSFTLLSWKNRFLFFQVGWFHCSWYSTVALRMKVLVAIFKDTISKRRFLITFEYVLVSYVLSMLLNVLRRDCLWIRKTRLCRKKWFVDSTLRLKQQREFREPRKLCLNLCLRKCLRQASAYEACNRTRTPLYTPKTLETWRAKKTRLVWLKKLQGVRQIARLKQRYLSFTFYKTQRSYEKIMCIDLLFHWFSGENSIIFTFSSHKGRQASTD